MFDNLMMLVLFALGMYLLVTSVQAYNAGNQSTQNTVYVATGALMVFYNLKVVGKLLF